MVEGEILGKKKNPKCWPEEKTDSNGRLKHTTAVEKEIWQEDHH